ncbi:MAG TPA: hypothetical protein VJT31_09425, partial [Rugosimonospora sp.]|nr:hypothetical protein [Rugosimonospora sp.]
LLPWVDRLASLVRGASVPEVGVDWAEPVTGTATATPRAVGRASVVSGTETDAFRRIERLERELVRLRGAYGSDRSNGNGSGRLLSTSAYAGRMLASPVSAPPGTAPGAAAATGLPATKVAPSNGHGPSHGAPGGGIPAGLNGTGPLPGGGNGSMRGRAAVVPRPAPPPDSTGLATTAPEPPAYRPPVGDRMRTLRIGAGWTWLGLIFLFLSWCVWAVSNRTHNLVTPGFAFGVVLLVGGGLFALLRLVGRFVLERWLRKQRRSARLAHLGTGAYFAAVGVAYLASTSWVVSFWHWAMG